MKNAKTEEFSPAKLIDNREVRNQSFETRTFQRSRVEVKNALGGRYKKDSFDRFPNLDHSQKKRFMRLGLIPLSEIRYCLGWANLLTKESSKSFDVNDYIQPGVIIDNLTGYERDYVIAVASVMHMDDTPFDFPTGGSILGFLEAILNKYTDMVLKPKTKVVPTRFKKISAVPISDYILFLSQFRSYSFQNNLNGPDRTEIIQKLDEFVGHYVK